MRWKATMLAVLTALPGVLAPGQVLAAPANARTGCMNQWLFNGVWRAQVTKVEPIMDGANQTGWQVTQTWRNGTARELAPADSTLLPEQLVLADGTRLEGEAHRQEGLAFNTLAPSGQFSYTQVFFGSNMHVDPGNKPKTMEVSFDNKMVSQSNKPHFTSRQYDFDYDLSCVATGAAAQAQGGSAQLAAQNGCMNQWMSNGVWKMRVLAVVPNPPGVAVKDQNGWTIRQEWVNVSHMKVYPGALADPGNRVAPTNTSDEFLATKSGNNASTFNMAGGFSLGRRNVPFLPGVPFTFDQLISWSPFDGTDPPIRLLVTFDTAAQRKTQMSIPVPQYRGLANFRISLTCGGSVQMAAGAAEQAQQQNAQQKQQASQPAPQAAATLSSKSDPCAMLTAPDVATALGVGTASVGAAQRPSAGECSWAVAPHSGAPAQNVVLVMQPVSQSGGCHGFGCLGAVKSFLGSHGVPGLPPQFSNAFDDAQLIAGLGDKASWKDGRLTVLRADTAFQVLVHGSQSPSLGVSEALARDVLYRIATP